MNLDDHVVVILHGEQSYELAPNGALRLPPGTAMIQVDGVLFTFGSPCEAPEAPVTPTEQPESLPATR